MRMLIVWALIVLTGTLAPFDFGPLHEHSFKAFLYSSDQGDLIHLIFNLLLFMPLGALLHHEGQSRSLKLWYVVLVSTAGGFAISASIESMQAFLPSRDSSLIDVMANTAGAVLGIAVDRSWGASLEAWAYRLRARTSPVMLAGLMAGFLGVALLISGALQAGTRLSNWSAEYPLLIGNERTGDRPWRGRVLTLAITHAAAPLADELQTYKMAYLAALFLPPGVLVGLMGRTRRDRRCFSVVYPTAAAVLLELTLVLASGRTFDWGNVAVTAGVGTVVVTGVSMILSQPDLQRDPGRGLRVASETAGS